VTGRIALRTAHFIVFAAIAVLASSPAAAQEDAGAADVAEATYPVAARDLARGEVLALTDIVPVSSPASADEDAADSLVGWTTRRVISAGEPLRAPAVSPPNLVKAGDTVQAIWRGKTIELRIAGTAAGSAALGERVLVRVDARRRLEGVVIGPALVQLESMDKGR
jgi:flagella basal body P-ring formation protein FlgA